MPYRGSVELHRDRRKTPSPDGIGELAVFGDLERLLAGRVCILGVGNRYRRDDGAGSLVAERLAGRAAALVIDAGAVPENYVEKIARSRPDTVLIVDAVDFAGTPGDLRLLDPDVIAPLGISSHALSLRMTAAFFKARTRARLAILGIQPADVGPGAEMSDEVSRAVQTAAAALSAVLGKHSCRPAVRNGHAVMPGKESGSCTS